MVTTGLDLSPGFSSRLCQANHLASQPGLPLLNGLQFASPTHLPPLACSVSSDASLWAVVGLLSCSTNVTQGQIVLCCRG